MMAPFAGPEAMGLVGLALRATLVLGAALLFSRILRRGSASTRHLLWTLTFVLLLGLPLAAAWLPGWEIPVLPATVEAAAGAGAAPAGGVVPELGGIASGLGTGLTGLSDGGPGQATGVPNVSAETSESSKGVAPGFVGTAVGTSAGTRAAARSVAGAPGSSGPVRMPIALLLWALGSAGAIASVTVGTLRFRALVRRGRPVENPVWLLHLGRLRARLGIDAEVRLLTSDDITTPMTGGWRRPAVLLPTAAEGWTPERRDVVLLHEMIHVKRHDALRQIVARAALALYWFIPLSWIAARLATVCREEACDEAVLAMGTRPSEYAGHLLALAESVTQRPALAALPMIQPSQLERRIMAILSPRRPRTSAIATAGLIVALGGFGLSAALAQPVQAPARAADTPPEIDGPVREREGPAVEQRFETTPTPTILERLETAADGRFGSPPSVLPAQDPTCEPESWRGNFTGSVSIREGRQERAGFGNGERIIQKYVDDLRLCMRIHGEVVMTDDRDAVRAIGRDGWLVLESEDADLRRLVITEGSAGIEYDWSIDGRSSPFDDDARAWQDHMFRILDAYWEASSLRGQQSSLRGRISSARGHVSSLRGQISSARGRVSSLRGQISSANGRVSSMNGRISSMRGHVSSLNGRISSLNGRISSLRSARRSTDSADTREALDREIQGIEERIRQTEREIADYDLEARIREVEREKEQYDVNAIQQRLEAEIAEYDIDGRVAELEQEIEDYDLDGRIREIEREIDELDADRRADSIEAGIQSEVDALRRLIGR